MRRKLSRHELDVNPKTHAVRCSCGDHWEGFGAADSAEEHLAAATSRRGRRQDRLGTLAGGKTTALAAEAWGLTKTGAFAYLSRLARRGLVVKTVRGKFPRRATWALATRSRRVARARP